MKRRLMSGLLAFVLLFSMVSEFLPSARSKKVHDPNMQASCEMIPYAYNAMQWHSPYYYVAHYNIKRGYDYSGLQKSFDEGIPQGIVEALDDPFTDMTRFFNETFSFDGEFTEQDFYDYVLIYMLTENALGAVQTVNTDDANKMTTILNTVVDGVECVDEAKPLSGTLGTILGNLNFKSIDDAKYFMYSLKRTQKQPLKV